MALGSESIRSGVDSAGQMGAHGHSRICRLESHEACSFASFLLIWGFPIFKGRILDYNVLGLKATICTHTPKPKKPLALGA